MRAATAVTLAESINEFAIAPDSRGSVRFGISNENGAVSDNSLIFGKTANSMMAIMGRPTMITKVTRLVNQRAGASRLLFKRWYTESCRNYFAIIVANFALSAAALAAPATSSNSMMESSLNPGRFAGMSVRPGSNKTFATSF